MGVLRPLESLAVYLLQKVEDQNLQINAIQYSTFPGKGKVDWTKSPSPQGWSRSSRFASIDLTYMGFYPVVGWVSYPIGH